MKLWQIMSPQSGTREKKRRSAASVVVTVAAAILIAGGVSRIPFFKEGGINVIITAAALIYLPLPYVWKSGRPSRYGLIPGKTARNLLLTIGVAVAVLVPFYLVFFRFRPPVGWEGVFPDHPLRLIIVQFLIVAIPEEFFFRGWLQTELDDRSKIKWNIAGAKVGPGWVAANLLFALTHLAVYVNLTRAFVFFPGLLFGWLRARTGSVLYPAILHAVCNITFILALKASAF